MNVDRNGCIVAPGFCLRVLMYAAVAMLTFGVAAEVVAEELSRLKIVAICSIPRSPWGKY